MILVTLNAVFAMIFGLFAWRTVPRGWWLLRSGWLLLDTHAAHSEDRQRPANRQAISQGGRFFLAGILWLLAALAAGTMALGFAWQALVLLRA